MTDQMAEAPGVVANPVKRTDRRAGTDRRSTLRCNATSEPFDERPPQKRPRAPLTEWGRPRAELGWSLRDVAERTGIDAGELSRIERGRSCPSREQARRLLAVYDGATS